MASTPTSLSNERSFGVPNDQSDWPSHLSSQEVLQALLHALLCAPLHVLNLLMRTPQEVDS